MKKLSVFIIAKNEEINIERAISSVINIASEVIVIDSGSTDKTITIAEKLGAKVVFNEWPGYVRQKTYGESLCSNDWILNIDADEEVSTELIKEIEYMLNLDRFKFVAYYIRIKILHRIDKKARFLAPFNKQIRLYNRKFCSFKNSSISTHDVASFNEDISDQQKKTGSLYNDIWHRSGTSIEQLVAKANFYSSEQASEMVRKDKIYSKLRIICSLPLWFFKAYFLRRYFIFGLDGFVDSLIFAFARFLKVAKTRERKILKKDGN